MASLKNIITDTGLTELITKIKTLFSNINVAYGVCNTAANVSAKEITITSEGDFKLKVGARICVKYTNTNTASNCTINVNNTGAKPVWYSNYEYISNGNYVLGTAGLVIQYVYDGTYWIWMGKSFDVNTTYSTATTTSSGLMSSSDKTKLDALSVSNTYTVTFSASGWTGESAPYTQSVTVSGITADDEPILSLSYPDTVTSDTAETYEANYNYISKVQTSANTLTATCLYSVPTMDITVKVRT